MRESPVAAAPAATLERSTPRRLALKGALLAATVGALAVIGPFGTFVDLSWEGRFAYWGGLILFGWVLFEGLSRVLVALAMRRGLGWRGALAAVAGAVVLVMTLVVAAVERAVRGNDFLTPAGFVELFLYVGVLTLLAAAVPVWLELRGRGLIGGGAASKPAAAPQDRESPAPAAPAERGEEGQEAPFLDRLPAALGRQLLALSMEDHYVRVHTEAGSDLLLMRLRDAVAELSGVDGLRVHRSHWVAARAVAAVDRDRHGKLTLVLTNGLRIPVSRRHAAAVRAAGWG